MNVRKPVNYSTMYRELTAILARNLPQMDEVYAIGKVIGQRPENVVIMEAELTREARKWYLEQAQVQQWSKAILLEKLASAAHLEKPLDAEADTCYTNKEAEDGPQHPVVVAFRRCWFVSPFHEIAALLQDLPIHFLRRTSRRMLHARC